MQIIDVKSVSVDSLEKFAFEEEERRRAVFVKLMEKFLLCCNERHLSILISYEKN